MSAKNLDHHNRWRNRTVAFRVSEAENMLIDTFAKLSGHTKQDYITERLLCRDVVVQGNPRVYKALRDQLAAVLQELKQIEEIRRNNSAAANQRGKVNVFEELEKKAKVKKVNTHSLNVGPTTGFPAHTGGNEGTSVLRSGPAVSHPGFVIEKNIMFVSTNEVM